MCVRAHKTNVYARSQYTEGVREKMATFVTNGCQSPDICKCLTNKGDPPLALKPTQFNTYISICF